MSKKKKYKIPPIKLVTISRYLLAVRGTKLQSGEKPFRVAAELLRQSGLERLAGDRDRDFVYANAEHIRTKAGEVPSVKKRRVSSAVYEATRPAKVISAAEAASDVFLDSYEWRRIRMMALKKHGARCQCCGATPATGATIHVDHIKPRRDFPALALVLDNLQVLCHECNHGKGNWDTTDWRPAPHSLRKSTL